MIIGPAIIDTNITNAHLAAIVTSSSDAILSKTLDGIIMSWNAGAVRMFGYPENEIVGQPITKLIPPDRISEEAVIVAKLRDGQLINHYETVRVTKDGKRLDVSLTISPVHDGSGRIVAASKIIRDISDRKRSEARIRLLLREVNHRSGNLLGVVQAIARQSLKNADPATFVANLSARIDCLSACQALLINSEWRGADTGDLVRAQMKPFVDLPSPRVVLSGPPTRLNPAAAQAIGLALHELATNACRHGALSGDRGRVLVNWSADPAKQEFAMEWIEEGGPAVKSPGTPGFGHLVIVRMTEIAMNGTVRTSYREQGFTWNLRAPLADTADAVS